MIDERQKAIRERLENAAPGPWMLCHHLVSVEHDNSCPCGFRGQITSEGEFSVCEMGSTCTPGEEGLELPRYPRSKEIANAHLIAAAPDDISYLLVALAEARELLNDLSESREFALYITPESKFGIRLAAWQDRNKKEV